MDTQQKHPVRAYRLANSLSLEDLGRLTNTDKSTISRIERGKQSPSIDLMRRIIAATGGAVTANDFVHVRSAPAESAT